MNDSTRDPMREAFEEVVKRDLGDVPVMDNGRYISPKINNYWLLWTASRSSAMEEARADKMTDAWLLETWERNMKVMLMRDGEDGPAVNLLRGFANRVLQFAANPKTLHEALSIAFVEHKAAAAIREAAKGKDDSNG